jgi:hypothetical protein
MARQRTPATMGSGGLIILVFLLDWLIGVR